MGISLSISDIGKNTFNFSTGDWAKQANGSVSVAYGDTIVLATACMSKEPREGISFFPLTVEYQEKTYAMGKIPGGFFKKEGRPKDTEILSARLIDRPLRPLFPKGLTNEIQIVAMVLSSDRKNDPDVLAINAASCALIISDIPFDIPVGAVRVAQIDGNFVINPTYEERAGAILDLVVVAREDSIVMLEGKFSEVAEKTVLEAIKFAHPFIKEIINTQKALAKKAGKKKKEVSISSPDEELAAVVREKVYPQLEKVYGIVEKEERENAVKEVLSSVYESISSEIEVTLGEIKDVFYAIEEEFMRKNILEKEKRPDGRGLAQIRDIDCKVRVLPRTHGSAVFTRGQTQAMAVTTLGTSSDEQFIEALGGESYKHFMLHYLFPGFSVGEVKPMRGPSRRDIGHGTLAEKSLSGVIPSKEEFPYTIRIVSEILESNGSSSMATVCAASLSLMDTGVPIKDPVAGIALGLVKENDNYKILSDIAGIEDHYGDMDFKVAGTEKGINAVQLDIKIGGLTYKIIEEALERAKEGRLFILDKMKESLSLPREALSKYAPKIRSFKIASEKIGSVIGPGGRMIRRLTRENNVNIDIDDETSTVSVVAETEEDLERAIAQITNLTRDAEVGDIYDAKVEKIVNFGAFCEIAPGKSGLVRIGEISDTYVKEVTDVLKEGDTVKVKVIGIDPQGRINLSIKQV
jgi:polyribonucleotide nucleotidyltransferase